MDKENHPSPKQLLAEFVEHIFEGYTTFGLHICDIATGGGKSYTIGKLTCEYYPQYFKRIIILCVQNKLVDAMNDEIKKFINTKESKIREKDVIIIRNNSDIIREAIKDKTFEELLNEMNYAIGEQKHKGQNVYQLTYAYNKLKKTFEGLTGIVQTYESNTNNDYLQGQVDEGESWVRKQVRAFFDIYKNQLEKSGQYKRVSVDTIIHQFPHLAKVYPQVTYNSKKVLLMTVHKAMYGIDPILSEKFSILNLPDRKKETLILFDESDQAATAMRDTIIDQAIKNSVGNRKYSKGYNGFLQYKELISNPGQIAKGYYNGKLYKAIEWAKSIISTNWKRIWDDIHSYNSIFLDKDEDLEDYRRGVFFSGPAIRLNVSQADAKGFAYICYREGDRHLTLVHSENKDALDMQFKKVIPLDLFLSTITNSITAVKAQFRKVVHEAYENSIKEFEKEDKDTANNVKTSHQYLGYPTMEREIHTLFSRFESSSERMFEQQLNEYITNRKNMIIKIGDKEKKLPDYSVYSQGVQLYQEEIDGMDNQHRVRLSCREITTTPEKIIVDLVNNGNTCIVLCSATASSMSVVSNLDVKYLKQTLGNQMNSLSSDDKKEFDRLVDSTYPSDHKIEIIPLDKFDFTGEKRTNHLSLPVKYKEMFSKEAQEKGLPEKWFILTRRILEKSNFENNYKNITYQFYRLFQFIEAYSFFIDHGEIHSMLFFQNRRGDRPMDRQQIEVLSCLVDGSFTDMKSEFDDDLPDDWENKHIRITKDWEEVETNILSDLSNDQDAKIMLVAAYGSFKAGANMQYTIPAGADYVSGDDWETDESKKKKDWDAIYVQSPTTYLMMNEDGNETTFEKSLYHAMLSLMMLYWRGCLSKKEVVGWLNQALSNKFYFTEKNNPGIAKDKAAWAQTVVEQAIGRLCRTRNKPRTTYILYDREMEKFFDKTNLDKSLTKEFRTLANYILEHRDIDNIIGSEDSDEVVRCNDANTAMELLKRLRTMALRYTVHDVDSDEDGDEEEGNVSYNTRIAQEMNQSYKHTIIRKPVIDSLDELKNEDKQLTFITKCYGDWNQEEDGGYTFAFADKRICPLDKGRNYTISPSKVHLDILMKNDIIRRYFEQNGYATNWKKGKYILHPEILTSEYAGEIGEEAFLALVYEYTDCKEGQISHLEGKDYELADFVLKNEDGSNRIAFDVKNRDPKGEQYDALGDMPTSEKRRIKQQRLHCNLITVNMIEIKKVALDETREMPGLIDMEGQIIPQNIERLKILINGKKN